MSRFSISFFALLALVFAAGCKSGSSTGPASAPIVVIPGIGSQYTFYEVTVDSAGAIQSTDTMSLQILQEHVSFGGYNDVATVLHTVSTITDSSSSIETDTLYYRFLKSGDIMESSMAAALLLNINWLTYPYGSHAQQNSSSVAPDDTVIIGEQYAGEQTLTLEGQAVHMSEVSQTNDINITNFTSQHSTTVMEYSPSSGVFGPSRDISSESNGASGNLTTQTLLSFTVK